MSDVKCACKGDYLDKFIQPAILTVVYEAPAYGFEIHRQLTESQMILGNSVDPTGMYRTLKKMEEGGLLSAEWDLSDSSARPKKVYSITEEGVHCLKNWLSTLSGYRDVINVLLYKISTILPEETTD